MANSEIAVRDLQNPDTRTLEDFLYLAIFTPSGMEPPPRDIIYKPEIFVYIDGFGKAGDYCVCAEQGGLVVGVAWARIIPVFGHVDDDTPELAISVLPEYRGKGIGTKMLERLFERLRADGVRQTSLSVQKANPAFRLYRRLGYEVVRENAEDYVMVKKLCAEKGEHDES